MVYSSEQAKPYLTQKGIMNLRSAFAKDVFADDLLSVYEKQTEHRNALRAQSRDVIAEIVSRINSGAYDNPVLENKLLELADRLSKTSGKKQYGYLKADVKAVVNGIVSDLAADERIASLYDLWYEQREKVIRTYTEELPERIPLVDNPEFKSIKNVVIQEALNISADRVIADEQDEQAEVDAETSEPEADEVEEQEYAPAPRSVQRSRMWQLYRSAKELLDRESNTYDPNTAVDLLIEAARLGCGTAKYRLGKMFLRGEDVPKNIDYALRWLEESVSEGNQYAEYLLGKTFLRGEDVDQDLPRAELLLRRSSDQGNRYASYTLGKTLLDGELLLQNIPEAIRLLTDSADKGFAAGQYQMGKLLYRGEVVPQDVSRAIEYLERSAEQKNPYAAYLAGKLRLTEAELKDVLRAIRDFEIAAENGNDYAEYQLGKIYLYGKEVERDYEKAIAYLSSAAEHGNQYAEQLLHSIQSNRNWSAALGSIRLLHHLSRMIQNQLDDEKKGKAGVIDRKLKRKIDEKKQAHGLKQG
jgi:sel1 repeat